MSHHSRRGIAQPPPTGYWTATQSYVFAVITLLLGIVAGYLIRGSSAAEAGQVPSTSAAGSNFGGSSSSQQQPSRSELAARVVEPLLQQLKTRPNDPELLGNIANAYYDGQDYPQAIEYYRRALNIRPDDVNVRTDMATAMWYSGDADSALKQYELSLKFQPTYPQTLFNMGIVKWQGKKDGKGAIQVWEKLLDSNPNYPDRQKVQQLLEQVRNEAGRGF